LDDGLVLRICADKRRIPLLARRLLVEFYGFFRWDSVFFAGPGAKVNESAPLGTKWPK
jgi:hypothetical protein